MSDLVRRSEILFGLNVFSDSENGNEHFLNGIETAKEIVEGAMTVDTAPVVHGHWTCSCIDKYELSYGAYGYIPQLMCSFCGRTADSYMRYDEPIMPEDMDGWRYCPNCGARMDGGIEDE